MRRLLAVLTVGVGLWAAPAKLPTLDEATYPHMLNGNRGHVTLVNFWATYCKPCRAEMPALVKLEQRLRARGFRLVFVSADEPEQESAAAGVIQQNGVQGPSYRKQAKDDDKFINSIDPKWSGALPASFLYDKNGRKVKAFFGEVNIAELTAAVEKAL